MNHRIPVPTRLVRLGAAILILGAPLGACGKLGQLQRPGPLNGVGPAPDRDVQDSTHPIDTIDPRDRDTAPAPPRTAPIDGSGQNPFALPPPGALPSPFDNPR